MNAKVDVIIPVYNGGKFIKEAIDSILNQTYQDFRILIVDDGSSDNTISIVQSIQKETAKIVLFEQAHFGQPKTINRGLAATSADYICFLDADDYWEKDKLEKQLKFFHTNKEAVACFTMIKEFDSFEDNGVTPKYKARELPMKGIQKSTILFKRVLLEQYGYFDENQLMAVFINWFSKMQKDNIVFDTLDEVLVHRRVHDANFTKTINRTDYLQVLKRHLKGQ